MDESILEKRAQETERERERQNGRMKERERTVKNLESEGKCLHLFGFARL